MLKLTTFLAFIFLFTLTSLSIYYVAVRNISDENIHKWTPPKEITSYPTKQIRTGVQKDLWISDNGLRLHHQILSPQSILTAYPKGESFELVEDMHEMKCYLQEHIEPGEKHMQQIRFIKSHSGTYRYSDQYFHAQQVFLALFKIPGNTLDTHLDFDTALLKGVAEKVSLSLAENSPNFHAEKFKAYIHSNKQHD